MPQISRGELGTVKGKPKRFWLQIAVEIAVKSFSINKLRQKWAWNSGLGDIKRYCLPLPPRAEQTEIFDEIERRLSIVDEIGDQVEANLKRAARLRQGILKRAFEGCLVPQDPGPPHQNRWTGTNG